MTTLSTLPSPEPILTALTVAVTPAGRPGTPLNVRSILILTFTWLILQFGGIFSPGLLDDVDSLYIEVAREMLQRHDFVTPYVNGIRFFDKPPLMYWMAAGSMKLFGRLDWAARLPLALAVLALVFSVYALGNRLFATFAPNDVSDRGGFYSALAVVTSIGPYLYTRFFIPDILVCLWMTLGIHLFLIALERIQGAESNRVSSLRRVLIPAKFGRQAPRVTRFSRLYSQTSLLPCLAFAAVLALNLLTKGLIGLVFPVAFVLLYLVLTHQISLIPRFHPVSGTAVFLAIAAPWHILAALQNPAIALPSGLGLPAKGGWAWFYLYNEHIGRFLSLRIPHDYGQTPVWLFWLYLVLWIMPWATFLPGFLSMAIPTSIRIARQRAIAASPRHEAALALLLWAFTVLGFFTLSARQEYYSLPAIPALCLMAGGLLARTESNQKAHRAALQWSFFFLVPIATATAAVCTFFAVTAPHPAPGAELSTLLATNPALYNLSLGHLFDLTGPALGLFRGPLWAVALGLLAVGIGSTLLRWKHRDYAANLTMATGMIVTLVAAHAAFVRFNPVLGSYDLAQAVGTIIQPDDLLILDGELTNGSTLLFYTRHQVHVVDGRVNTLWYGSFWPDSPRIFETDTSLHTLWRGPQHVLLLTLSPRAREIDLLPFGPINVLRVSGGKAILTNFTPPSR